MSDASLSKFLAVNPPVRSGHLSIFLLMAAAGFAMRLWVSQLGFNDDLIEWQIVSDLLLKHENVYAVTDRFSYGPGFFVLLYPLVWLAGKVHLNLANTSILHALLAGFLSFADIAVAAFLRQRTGLFAAGFMLLNPVLILLTGYHSQVDMLAILFALMAWRLLESRSLPDADISLRRLISSALLMAISLAIKQIFLFFPLWLFLAVRFIPQRRRRLTYMLVVYGLFFGSFVPFMLTPAGAVGTWNHALSYTGLPSQKTLIAAMVKIIIPADTIYRLTPSGLTALHKTIFTLGMCGIGWLMARDRPHELFERYLLAMFTLLVSVAPQYLSIPLIACAVMWRRWESWGYLAAALAFLLVSPYNISNLYVRSAPWIMTLYEEIAFWHVQLWTGVLLCAGWLKVSRRCDVMN